MEGWLIPSQLLTFLSTIILALALLYLYRQYHERYLNLWVIGWGFYALRFVIELYRASYGSTPALQALHDIIHLTSGLFLLWGARELTGQRLPRSWLALAALGAIWSLATTVLELPFLVVTAPSFTLVALIYVYTGVTFLRHSDPGRAGQVVGWAFIVWGLHKTDYPLLRNADWFAPWGFMLSGMLELIITFSFFILYFEKVLHEQRQSEERFRAIFEQAGVGVNITDHISHRYLRVNQKLCEFLGYSAEELLAIDFPRLTHPDDLPLNLELAEQITQGKMREFSMEKRYIRKDGSQVWALLTVTPLWLPGKPPSHHVAIVQDITPRKLAEAELQTRLDQQVAVAQLGQLALTGADLRSVLQAATEQVTETLGIEFSKVLRLLPDGSQLQLVAAAGLDKALIDQVVLSAGPETQAGYTLAQGEAIIVEDLSSERRFQGSALLRDQRASSGVSVIIAGAPQAYGVLTAHSQQPHRFSQRDIGFLQSIANVLSMAARQEQAGRQLQRYVAELETLERISGTLRLATGLDEITHKVLAEILAFFAAPAGCILLFDPLQPEAEKVTARGWLAGPFPPTANPLDELLNAARAAGAALVYPDFAAAAWKCEEVRQVVPAGWSGAVVPLHTGEGIIGLMILSAPLPRQLAPAEVHLLETIAEMSATAIQRNHLHAQTRRNLARMAALHEIDVTISSSRNLKATLATILKHCILQLEVDAAEIYLWNEETHSFEVTSRVGFGTDAGDAHSLRLGEGTVGQAALHRRSTCSSAPLFEGEPAPRKELYRHEAFSRVCAVPLISRGAISGVLQVCQHSPTSHDRDWFAYLDTMGGQAAIAIENLGLFEHLERSNAELALAYNETIEGWSRAMDLRDKETEGHTRRVTEMAVRLAEELGIAEEEIDHIRRGALLHDIGKMGVPDEILNKPGALEETEWAKMRKHPQFAYEMLQPIHYLRPALIIPHYHHERWDGSGYPDGLAGEEIPLAARIFAIVDVWDALRSPRSYRGAWPEEKVRAYLRENASHQFDPRLVEVFLNMLERLPPEEIPQPPDSMPE